MDLMKRDDPMTSVLRNVCKRLAGVVRTTVWLLAAVMLVTLVLQIILRYVFDKPLSWSEELAITCFSWCMLLAIALGVRDSIHVRMDLLIDRCPATLRWWLEKWISLTIAAIGLFLAYAGVNYVLDTASSGTSSAAMGYPLTYLYASAPVCGLLIAVFALEHALLGAPEQSPSQPD